jgi:tRNA-specific 2-thiouridylase
MDIDERILERARAGLDLPADPAGARVVVAMSGGVDSSVVAALLKRLGYDVVGVTLQLYDHGAASGRKGACCAGADIHDARNVAARLDIPHYVLDFERRFREAVIDDFADSYLAGETPIPCVRCNQTVKFTDLLGHARALGAEALATGHYARRARRADGSGGAELLTPEDMSRDQSYFLFATTPEQLAFLRFPLGGLTKQEVRGLAAAFRLDVADKPDSQDICFVPGGRYADVLSRLRPEAAAPGNMLDASGRVLGRHAGVARFTVGQRRGLGISAGSPLYVQAIDASRREVVVGPREDLARRDIRLRDLTWLGDPEELRGPEPIPVHVKIRSTRPAAPASLSREGGGARVRLKEAETGISPGQACVFYERPGAGARVLGGGFIAAAREDSLRAAG